MYVSRARDVKEASAMAVQRRSWAGSVMASRREQWPKNVLLTPLAVKPSSLQQTSAGLTGGLRNRMLQVTIAAG